MTARKKYFEVFEGGDDFQEDTAYEYALLNRLTQTPRKSRTGIRGVFIYNRFTQLLPAAYFKCFSRSRLLCVLF